MPRCCGGALALLEVEVLGGYGHDKAEQHDLHAHDNLGGLPMERTAPSMQRAATLGLAAVAQQGGQITRNT